MGKILIIPDVHGRTFWIEPCKHVNDFEKVVFLGDMVSPYPHELISNEMALEVFKDVLKFKEENPEKVVLLFGNHDGSYINSNICECRTDWGNWNELNRLYTDNIRSFDLCWETEIDGKRYFFSHSGVRKGWFDMWVKDRLFKWDSDELPPAEYFNNLFHAAYDDGRNYGNRSTHDFERAIGAYSIYRGWDGYRDGSIVWADIREYALPEGGEPEYPNVRFICGHTQLEDEPIIREWVADLDVRRPFVLDTETGAISEYESDRQEHE